MSIEPGVYIIRPKDSDGDALLIGPVPATYPPFDVPVRVGSKLIDRWIVRAADNNTFTVFAGRGNPNDYKWVVQNNSQLFVSAIRPPDSFRFESAGNGLWTIGIFGEDSLLTFGGDEFPPLTFRPADGSSAQRYELIRIDRE